RNIVFPYLIPVNFRHTERIQGYARMSFRNQYFLSQKLLYLIYSFSQILSSYILVIRAPEDIDNLFSCDVFFHTEIIEKTLCFFIRKVYSFSIQFYIWSS